MPQQGLPPVASDFQPFQGLTEAPQGAPDQQLRHVFATAAQIQGMLRQLAEEVPSLQGSIEQILTLLRQGIAGAVSGQGQDVFPGEQPGGAGPVGF